MAEVTAEDIAVEWFEGFSTFWAGRTELYVPGLIFDPDIANGSYARIELAGREEGERQRSGDVRRRIFERQAVVTVEIGVRAGDGYRLAYRLVDEASVWLANPGLSTALVTGVGTPVQIGLEGGWYVLTVSADWRYLTDRE